MLMLMLSCEPGLNTQVDMLHLDLAKAFDTVDYMVLLYGSYFDLKITWKIDCNELFSKASSLNGSPILLVCRRGAFLWP